MNEPRRLLSTQTDTVMNTTQSATQAIPCDLLDPKLRRITAVGDAAYRPYDRYGALRDDMEWLPLGDAVDREGGAEIFLLRFKPGATSTPHEHTGGEEFYVIDGELTDCDGAILRAGDYVKYQPGSRHFSTSKTGCTLLAILHGRNARVEP